MSLTTLPEYGCTDGFDWTERDVRDLERLRDALGAEVLWPVIRRGRRELCAAQYVGVAQLGKRRVQVIPKIGAPEPASGVVRNLLVMLGYACDVPPREAEATGLLRGPSDWFEALTRLFATRLAAEWARGPARAYEPVDDELPDLRGRWRVADQLRRPARGHAFSVRFDEFTADNRLNRAFRFVTERLWLQAREADNRRLLGDLRSRMDEVALPAALTARDAGPELINRLNARFGPPLSLARLFLGHAALLPAAGDAPGFGFFLDMNLIFEGFLAGIIRRHRGAALPPALADCEVVPQGRGAVAHLAVREGGPRVFRLKPDLAFRRGGRFPLLLDAKYKRLDPRQADLGVVAADFYQMTAYALRFGCPRILMVYPQPPGGPVCGSFEVEGAGVRIDVGTIDLARDLGPVAGRSDLIAELAELMGRAADARG
jgi:5-methylcytosine-specific restriction enzyme subunit McrC